LEVKQMKREKKTSKAEKKEGRSCGQTRNVGSLGKEDPAELMPRLKDDITERARGGSSS